MKNSLLLLIMAMSLSGCGIFQKIEKEKVLEESKTTQEATTKVKESDQGLIKTKEIWKFPAPQINPGDNLNPYKAPDMNALTGNADELKNALVNMQSEYKKLWDALTSRDVTYEKETTEKKDNTKITSENSKATDEVKNSKSNETKHPAINLTLIVIVGLALLLLIGFIFIRSWIVKIKKDLQILSLRFTPQNSIDDKPGN